MYKTKFGISVGLMGAIFCILGAVMGIQWPVLAIAGYILIKEENEWLKRIILKVIIILLAGAAIKMLVPYAFRIVYDIIDLFSDEYKMFSTNWTGKISDFITRYVSVIVDVILVLMGLKALKQGHFPVKSVDNIINKNI